MPKVIQSIEDLEENLREQIAEKLGIERHLVTLNASFEEDLNVDSLSMVELIMSLEERYGLPDIPEEEADKMKTVADVVNYVHRELICRYPIKI